MILESPSCVAHCVIAAIFSASTKLKCKVHHAVQQLLSRVGNSTFYNEYDRKYVTKYVTKDLDITAMRYYLLTENPINGSKMWTGLKNNIYAHFFL